MPQRATPPARPSPRRSAERSGRGRGGSRHAASPRPPQTLGRRGPTRAQGVAPCATGRAIWSTASRWSRFVGDARSAVGAAARPRRSTLQNGSALSPIHRWVWRDVDRRARKLLRFAETEADGGRDLARAAELTDDPLLRRLFLRHALDEHRHAELFRRAQSNAARRARALPGLRIRRQLARPRRARPRRPAASRSAPEPRCSPSSISPRRRPPGASRSTTTSSGDDPRHTGGLRTTSSATRHFT